MSSIVSNLNRNSISSDPRTSLGLQRGRRGGRGGHPTSGVVEEKRRSLAGLARRTMDSDTEEGVVG